MGEEPQRRQDRPVADPQVEVEPADAARHPSVEVPPEDAAEQARPAAEPADVDEEWVGDEPASRPVPLDADPADLAEQGREVDFDEDEYR